MQLTSLNVSSCNLASGTKVDTDELSLHINTHLFQYEICIYKCETYNLLSSTISSIYITFN